MKIITIVAAVILFITAALLACPVGQHEDSGICAYDTSASAEESAKWTSDEKPPTNKMPSYEREGIHVVTAPPGVEEPQGTAHDLIAEGKQR